MEGRWGLSLGFRGSLSSSPVGLSTLSPLLSLAKASIGWWGGREEDDIVGLGGFKAAGTGGGAALVYREW